MFGNNDTREIQMILTLRDGESVVGDLEEFTQNKREIYRKIAEKLGSPELLNVCLTVDGNTNYTLASEIVSIDIVEE